MDKKGIYIRKLKKSIKDVIDQEKQPPAFYREMGHTPFKLPEELCQTHRAKKSTGGKRKDRAYTHSENSTFSNIS